MICPSCSRENRDNARLRDERGNYLFATYEGAKVLSCDIQPNPTLNSPGSNCGAQTTLQEPIKNPARLDWHEVSKISHYYLKVGAMTRPMQVREGTPLYGGRR